MANLKLGNAANDLTGTRYEFLVALEPLPERAKDGQVVWLCRCDCGNLHKVRAGKLRTREVTSCGCGKAAKCAAANTTHGHSARGHMTPEYRAWANMIDRCERHSFKQFHDYGGRGICVAPEWRHDLKRFLADVGMRPGPEYSLDRYPDRDGNYEPGNVRWATWTEQNNNKRNNRFATHDGRTQSVGAWAKELGFKSATLYHRVVVNGESVADAISRPSGTRACPSPRRGPWVAMLRGL